MKKTFDILLRLRDFLQQRSIEGYLGGGFVRDSLLGREGEDIDVIIGANAMELAPEVAHALEGRYVPLDEVNQIARVVFKKIIHLDFSTMRGSIEEDLALRDFTINAIAMNIKDIEEPGPALIDPFRGREDLEIGVVRALGEEAFRRDAARLLRGPRLAAEFGFSLDGETKTQIERHHQLITRVASERVRDELCRLLAIPGAARWLRLLEELGLLEAILPQLSVMRGVEQPKEHFWDVLEHSLETVAAIEFLLRIGDSAIYNKEVLTSAPWSSELEQYFDEEVAGGRNRKTLLKMAGLLHDVAKPQAKAIDERGRIRFLGHAKEGASIARGIMERLRFSARERDMVEGMVLHHLRPAQMAGEGIPTRRAIYRYFRDSGDVAIDTIFLNLADHLATRGPSLELEEWQQHAHMLAYVLEQHFREESVVRPPKLIDGHDLIDIFGMKPGPELGELLEAVREAQAAGEINTREEALLFVRKRLPLQA